MLFLSEIRANYIHVILFLLFQQIIFISCNPNSKGNVPILFHTTSLDSIQVYCENLRLYQDTCIETLPPQYFLDLSSAYLINNKGNYKFSIVDSIKLTSFKSFVTQFDSIYDIDTIGLNLDFRLVLLLFDKDGYSDTLSYYHEKGFILNNRYFFYYNKDIRGELLALCDKKLMYLCFSKQQY